MRLSGLRILLRLSSFVIVGFTLLSLTPVAARAGTYSLSTRPITFQPLPIGGGTTTSLSGGNRFGGDTPAPQEAQVTLPFAVNFFGTPETNMFVSANGYVTLGTAFHATSFARRVIPGSAAPHNLVAAWWDQLVCDSEFLGTIHGPVLTQEVGTAPNRSFVVQWTDCRRYAVTGSKVTMQIWFFEGSSVIEVQYGSVVPGSTSNFTASMGIENSTGTDGTPGLSNTGTVCNPSCSASHFPSNTAFTYSNGPSLRIASVTGDANGSPGLPFHATATVENVGGGDAVGVDARFWLSDAPTFGGSAVPLFTAPAQSIPVGGSATFTLSAPLPAGLTDGNYYVIAEVDTTGAVAPAPLVGSHGPFTVATTAPDFAVGTIVVSSRVDPGGTLSVQWSARNLGSLGAAGVPYTVTLAPSTSPDATPVWILDQGRVDLLAGDDVPMNDTFQLPAEAEVGAWYVVVAMDPNETIDEAQRANNRKASAAFVIAPDVEILTTTLPRANLNEPYSVELHAAGGGGTYAWSVPTGSLPQGLSLQPQPEGSTILAGTPTKLATTSFSLEVTSLGLRKRTTFTLEVVERLRILTEELPTISVGDPIHVDLQASGGVPPYSWTVTSGNLPSGLQLLENGMLLGTPTVPFDGVLTVAVTDQPGDEAHVELPFVVTSKDALQVDVEPLSISLGAPLAGVTLAASGGMPPYEWSTSRSTRAADDLVPEAIRRIGQPPPGLSLSVDGDVSGSPAEAGSYEWVVTVQDARGDTAAATVEVVVAADRALVVGPRDLPGAEVGSEYAVVLEVDAAGSPVFSVAKGTALPNGMVLDPSGTLHGTPTREQLLGEKERDFAFDVRVIDGALRQGAASFTLRVTDPAWTDPHQPPDPGTGSSKSSKKKGGCQSAGGELGLLAFAVAGGITLMRRRS